jgi:YD repeat-containing protein
MMPPAKQLDPVLGVDIHIIQPPPPAPPVPIPHPFIGMVLDPLEFAPIIGATVTVHGIPAAIAGVECKCIPPHIPMGGVWVPPPPGNEGELFMGSATVSFDGDAASRLLHPALTCQSVGMPKPPRPNPKKKPKPKASLMLPTSMVLPIPGGPPVLIGGPPTISLMAMGMKLGMAALGKAFKKYKKFAKKSKRMKAISDVIHRKADNILDKMRIPKNARNKVHDGICAVTGHPVDVCAGKVFTDHVDVELPGRLPLKWRRIWKSTSIYDGPMGYGWHHSFDMKLAERFEAVAVILEDGRPLSFPALDFGETEFNRQERVTLFRDDDGYGLSHESGTIYRFTPLEGDPRNQLLTSVIDRATDARIFLSYDEKGYLSEITDSAFRRIQVVCDHLGRIEKVFLPHPKEQGQTFLAVRYVYDKHGDLVTVLDALNNAFHYKYENHLLIQETNRNGLNFFFEYDGNDHNARCTRTWGDGGIYNHKLTYDLKNNITVVEDSLGHKTTYHHDGVLPHKIVDALGHALLIEYDSDYNILKETDELGLVTQHKYNDRGNRLHLIQPDGAVIEAEFNELDLPVKVIDSGGNEWQWQYDDQGKLTARVDPLGRRFVYRYAGNQLIAFVDAAGGITALQYDSESNLTKMILPDGNQHQWRYNRLGDLILAVDPNGNQQRRYFDPMGQVVQIDEPDGNVRTISYDGEGNVVRAKDQHRDIVFGYRGMNRLVSRWEAGTTVRFAYDTEEQLIAIQNEQKQVYQFKLDARGDVQVESGFDVVRVHFPLYSDQSLEKTAG